MQIVSLGCKTACISVRTSGSRGCIWFEKGRAVHARVGATTGEAAFCRMIAWETGTFHIEHGLTTSDRSIDNDTTFLVMEGLRLRDEALHRRGGPEPAGKPAPARPVPRRARRYRSLVLVAETVLGAAVLAALGLGLLLRSLDAEAFPTPGQGQLDAAVVAAASETALPNPAGAMQSIVNDRVVMDIAGPQEVEAPEVIEPASPASRAPQPPVDPMPAVVEDALSSAGLTFLPALGWLVGESDMTAWSRVERRPVAPPPAYLRFSATSKVKHGKLWILVNGEEIYSRELAAPDKRRGFFKRRPAETFTDRWMLGAGEHRVVARLARPDEATQENSIVVKLGAGETRGLELEAGRRGKSIVWHLQEPSSATPQ